MTERTPTARELWTDRVACGNGIVPMVVGEFLRLLERPER